MATTAPVVRITEIRDGYRQQGTDQWPAANDAEGLDEARRMSAADLLTEFVYEELQGDPRITIVEHSSGRVHWFQDDGGHEYVAEVETIAVDR